MELEDIKAKKKSKFLVKKLRIVNAIETNQPYPGYENTWYLDQYCRLTNQMKKLGLCMKN